MLALSDFISNRLGVDYWHTTSLDRYEGIKASGGILVEPNLPPTDRYGGMPFVRSLGGVSLFNFPANFDLQKYEAEIPTNSIGEFIPFKRKWGRSIWLRIDAKALEQNLRSGRDIRALWREMNSTKRFMADIEGAHIGDIPIDAITNAYGIGEPDSDWKLL